MSATTATTTIADNNNIDALLERYLALLNEYTELRAALGAAQSGMYQNIARANFSADRGVRYGPDRFDERMQACRRLRIEQGGSFSLSSSSSAPGGTTGGASSSSSSPPRFTVVSYPPVRTEPGRREKKTTTDDDDDAEGEDRPTTTTATNSPPPPAGGEKKDDLTDESEESEDESTTENEMEHSKEQQGSDDDDDNNNAKTAVSAVAGDPLRWFGILTPMPLRLAQKQAVQAVEDLVPRLAGVDAEMALVEIEVRRARKWRAKKVAAGPQAAAKKKPGEEEKKMEAAVAVAGATTA